MKLTITLSVSEIPQLVDLFAQDVADAIRDAADDEPPEIASRLKAIADDLDPEHDDG